MTATTATLADFIRSAVNRAPELTPDQRAKLAGILRPREGART